jgi:hypothetical protein
MDSVAWVGGHKVRGKGGGHGVGLKIPIAPPPSATVTFVSASLCFIYW